MSLLLLLQADARRRRGQPGGVPPRTWRGKPFTEVTMRPVEEWTEADLKQLVRDQVQENGELEYKRSQKLTWDTQPEREKRLNDLSKHVSAFANSNGGTLIFGIAEDGKTHLPTVLDAGLDPSKHGREWLEQIIRSNIRDAPADLRIHAIPIAGGPRVAYVVSVPMLPRGCQARDRRYYRRRNFLVEALDDWEIRELLSRAVQPDVALEIAWCKADVECRHLVVRLRNVGTVRVQDWKVAVEMPVQFIFDFDAYSTGTRQAEDSAGGTYEVRRFVVGNSGPNPPLFPGEPVDILRPRPERFFLRYRWDGERRQLARDKPVAVTWKVHADDLPERRGAVHMREIPELTEEP